MKNRDSIHFMVLLLVIVSCNNGPKVIAPSSESENPGKGSGIFAPDPSIRVTTNTDTSFNEDLHKVVVQEILPTDRYVYLKVREDGHGHFWIATRKLDVKKGEIYYYRNGLLKTNFESKEYKRVFDTIFLVSNLVAEDHSKNAGPLGIDLPMQGQGTLKEDIPTHTDKIVDHKGTLKIAELVNDPKKYQGHTVQIKGTCVKVNANIMDRNWIHLQDGSNNDFDLVITSSTFVPEGSKITIRGVVNLNRDFGAGYIYNLIIEDGVLVQ